MNPRLTEKMIKATSNVLVEWELLELADVIIPTLESCVKFRGYADSPTDEHPHTFLGGCPSLPANVSWPTFDGKKIPFVGQVNLAVLPKLPMSLFPSTGLLYFFFWCTNDVADHPACVIFTKHPGESEINCDKSDIRKDWQGDSVYERFGTNQATTCPTLSRDMLEAAV